MEIEASFGSPTGLMHLVRVGNLSIFLLVGSVTDEKWQEMLAWSQARLGSCTGSLAYLPHGNVTPRQRRAAAAQHDRLTKRVCLLTDSAILRGTLTAYSWLKSGNVAYGAFAPAELDRALAWLAAEVEFDVTTARGVLRRFERMASERPPASAPG